MVQAVHYQVQCNLFSCGKTLKKSCEMAIKYVNHAIVQAKYGKGHGPINHLEYNVNKKFK